MKTWMKARRWAPALALTALLALAGCGDLGDDPASPNGNNGNGNGNGNVVSWEGDIVPQVITPLGCFTCHGNGTQEAGLNLQDFSEWIDEDSQMSNPYVDPGSPGQSELVWRLEGSNGVSKMPPTANSATQAQIDLVRTWIAEGAVRTE